MDAKGEARWITLIETIEQLAHAQSIAEVAAVVRARARKVANADGVTFVLRDGELCHYLDENAIAPLWKGKRFPLTSCISGWCMLNKQTAVIPDIYLDPRIPHDAYRPTFVRSLVMVPVGCDASVAAIGSYWRDVHRPSGETVALLESLARAATAAIAGSEIRRAIGESRQQTLN